MKLHRAWIRYLGQEGMKILIVWFCIADGAGNGKDSMRSGVLSCAVVESGSTGQGGMLSHRNAGCLGSNGLQCAGSRRPSRGAQVAGLASTWNLHMRKTSV